MPILWNIACIIFVYDISVKSSFENIPQYLKYYKRTTIFNQSALKILVGNKIDEVERRQVTKEEGIKFAEKNDMLFFEVSAKNGANHKEVFMQSARIILDGINKGKYDLKDPTCGIIDNKRVGKDKKNINSVIVISFKLQLLPIYFEYYLNGY